MADIVDELHEHARVADHDPADIYRRAADEIEDLRAQVQGWVVSWRGVSQRSGQYLEEKNRASRIVYLARLLVQAQRAGYGMSKHAERIEKALGEAVDEYDGVVEVHEQQRREGEVTVIDG